MDFKSISKELLIDFIDELSNKKDFNSCFRVLVDYIKKLGFDDVLYSYVPLCINSKPVIKTSETSHDSLIKNGFISECNTHDDINYWTSKSSKIELDNKAFKGFGIEHGVSCRAFLSNNAYAGVNVVCRKSKEFFEKTCVPNTNTLKTMTHIFYIKMELDNYNYQMFVAPLFPNINTTKAKILQGLAQGLKPKQIAYELRLSEKYVQNLNCMIRKEFNCRTNEQLMYVASIIQLEDIA